MIDSYIAIGSNLATPQVQFQLALEKLEQLPKTQLLKCSSFYWNQPESLIEQPAFLNAVIKLSTSLAAKELLKELLYLEQQQGRIRNQVRWGPRVLDLDILLYGQNIINSDELQIPHPHMYERAFVLIPLAEIEPDLLLPTGESIKNLIKNIQWEGLIAKVNPY